MLFHVSIEADDPRRVARALADILGGEAAPFPPVGQGSWVALAGDDRGTMVEVYPRGTELHIGEGGAGAFGLQGPRRRNTGVHIAIATKRNVDEIFSVAHRENWAVKYCRRGGAFDVIEMWIEGCQMIEVLTPEMQREYLDAISIDDWNAMLEQRQHSILAEAA